MKNCKYMGCGYFREEGVSKGVKAKIEHAPELVESLIKENDALNKKMTMLMNEWDKWCEEMCVLLGMDKDFYGGTCKATRFIETKIKSLLLTSKDICEPRCNSNHCNPVTGIPYLCDCKPITKIDKQ